MAGFHEIVEAVHCVWLCLIEEMWMNGLDMFCTVYYDEKDVQYVQMLIVYIAFLKFP